MAGPADTDSKKFDDALKKLKTAWDDLAKEASILSKTRKEMDDLEASDAQIDKKLDKIAATIDTIEKALKKADDAVKEVVKNKKK